MSDKIQKNLTEMIKKLTEYVDKGREVGYRELKEESVIASKPDRSKIKPLRKVSSCDAHFLAVDCSTRTLKRANNWGIYLLRAASASIKGRKVDWSYVEKICTVIGSAYERDWFLRDARLELESEMAFDLLCAPYKGRAPYGEHYLLLDGVSFFGEKRGFKVSLYERCKKWGTNLLAISKQSSALHDEKGRDFMATAYMISPYPIWVYHPVDKANLHKHLYGDKAVIKLFKDSPRVFRCDIMEYLTDREIDELLSPLTFISEDPRCLGYPIPLWLAHDFSRPSNSMLFHYYTQVEETLANKGLRERLRMEELSCNFPDTLHGRKYPYELERIEYV